MSELSAVVVQLREKGHKYLRLAQEIEDLESPAGPTRAGNGKPIARDRAVKPARKERKVEVRSGSTLDKMLRSMKQMEGNFTTIEFRQKMRDNGGSRTDCGNVNAFLKRRAAIGQLTQVEHNGEIFYRLAAEPATAEAADET